MFWFALMVFGLAAVFMKLGAYSVWVSVLSAALTLTMLVVFLGLFVWGIVFCWKKLARNSP